MKASSSDHKRELLRHTLATVAYRGGKATRNAPAGFGDFQAGAGAGARTPGQILAHIGDLFDWGLSIAKGQQAWNDSKPLAWDAEVARFHSALKAFDDFLASSEPLQAEPEKLFQGPVADSLTHIGQIVILRRLAEGRVTSENYYRADIVAGRVGAEQTPPKKEF